MTDTPRNEAAERLRDNFTMHGIEDWTPGPWEQLDAALAEERRHVIEQIRERLAAAAYADRPPLGKRPVPWSPSVRRDWQAWAARILDDLSTPEQDA